MSLNLFPVRVPIGRVTPEGSVLITPEFSRALSDLLVRVGGENGMSSDDVAALASSDAISSQISASIIEESKLVSYMNGSELSLIAVLLAEIAELRACIAIHPAVSSVIEKIDDLTGMIAMIEDPAALVRYQQARAVQPSDAKPIVDGAGTPGNSDLYSRGDHQHPLPTPGTVTGSRAGNAALNSLLTALAASGYIVNSTTA